MILRDGIAGQLFKHALRLRLRLSLSLRLRCALCRSQSATLLYSGMVKCVLVHGTFATRESVAGTGAEAAMAAARKRGANAEFFKGVCGNTFPNSILSL